MVDSQDKRRLRMAAESLRSEIRGLEEGTVVSCVARLKRTTTNTNGWKYVIARFGRGQPRAELWLDSYPRARQRRFWYGFYSPHRSQLQQLINRVPHLAPTRKITSEDIEKAKGNTWHLQTALERGDYSRPIFEQYYGPLFYFGMFDPAPMSGPRGLRLVVRRAAAFIEEVARAMPRNRPAAREFFDFPHVENRRVVRRHLDRERSGVLAEERKIRDDYRCQVCGMTFEQVYGDIGREFAEAHHRVPLARLRGQVQTTMGDLVTVCANCHRMLHRMRGEHGDVTGLRRRIRRRKRP